MRPANGPGNPRTGSSISETLISSIVRRHIRCSGRSASGGLFFARAAPPMGCSCADKSSISSAVDIGSTILEYFDQSAKGGQFDNPVAGIVDFFVLQLPRMRVWNENGAQARGHRGVDVRARTVANHEGQRRIEIGVAHETTIRVDVFFPRRLDAIEQRPKARARELLQLLIA